MNSGSAGEPEFALSHRLYFLRHGETDWNSERRLQGTTDIPLNDVGRAQAKRHGQVMAGLGEDWTTFTFAVSPLLRTRETFEIVRSELNADVEAVYDERLREGSFGRWEGWTWQEVVAREPEGHARWLAACWSEAPHGGETYGAIARRFADWAQSITGPTVVIAHGGVSRVLRALYEGVDRGKLATLPVPQNRFMRLDGGGLEWI